MSYINNDVAEKNLDSILALLVQKTSHREVHRYITECFSSDIKLAVAVECAWLLIRNKQLFRDTCDIDTKQFKEFDGVRVKREDKSLKLTNDSDECVFQVYLGGEIVRKVLRNFNLIGRKNNIQLRLHFKISSSRCHCKFMKLVVLESQIEEL